MNIQTGQLMLISCVKYKINAMLSKIQYFVKETILPFIYFAIFHPDLSDVCTVMGKSSFNSQSKQFTGKDFTYNLFCKIQ